MLYYNDNKLLKAKIQTIICANTAGPLGCSMKIIENLMQATERYKPMQKLLCPMVRVALLGQYTRLEKHNKRASGTQMNNLFLELLS